MSKARVGATVRKTYHAPATSYARLLVSVAVTEAMKERLRSVAVQLDPLRLLDEIRSVQHHLAALAAGETPHPPPPEGDLPAFISGLATAWHHGEVRATHRRTPRPARDWRTGVDPFEAVWPCVRTWLEAEPDRVGREFFNRLQGERPGVFPDSQLRTFQRRVREWRQAGAPPRVRVSVHGRCVSGRVGSGRQAHAHLRPSVPFGVRAAGLMPTLQGPTHEPSDR